MQSWASFTTGGKGSRFFAILSSVNKNGHLYKTLNEKRCAAINFMSADFYDKSMERLELRGIKYLALGYGRFA